ncbi:helix-turn-helix domain-containing protein [Kaistia sp. MMO-174]|uniref:helix-turn-helix domain-containing protein n=1 Tax=Kaistia sp. MMO-174 TaxID=3081256 RepID=UPI00301908C4
MRTPRNLEHGPDGDEDLPEAVIALIGSGVSPLTAVRQWRGLSIEDLAIRSGVRASVIRSAEGGTELSPEAQVKLAWALDVGADLFID